LVENHKSTPANINCAFRSVTLDVITIYTLRTNPNATSFPSFNHPDVHGMDTANAQVYAIRHMLWLGRALNRLPRWLALLLSPSSRPILDFKAQLENLIDAALKDSHDLEYDPNSGPERNVFHTLISNARVEDKSTTRVTRDWLFCTVSTLRVATAVIKESLRLSHGVVSPMQRVVPDSGAVIAEHSIPSATIVSIANSFVHMNPDIFPEPESFRPE
ncbi:hypothetical protein MPER_06686, partial [Moniliophthora perniciosa FA553]